MPYFKGTMLVKLLRFCNTIPVERIKDKFNPIKYSMMRNRVPLQPLSEHEVITSYFSICQSELMQSFPGDNATCSPLFCV